MPDDTARRWLRPLFPGDPGRNAVDALAHRLAGRDLPLEDRVRRCFLWVRDEVAHTGDARCGRLTSRPGDVLEARTGYCYAKAHLLVEMLRTVGVPSGLCYQRLRTATSDGAPLGLHGLAAVRIPNGDRTRWLRLDPRGNTPELHADFSPPAEVLPFVPRLAGECDLPAVYDRPLPEVLAALASGGPWNALQLPDRPACADTVSIRWADPQGLDELRTIESAAAARFAEVGMPEVAESPTLDLSQLAAARAAGRVFVAYIGATVVGFCVVDLAGAEGRLAELSVLPGYGRRGVGSALLEYACDWARDNGLTAMTLRTFRDVAFNAPFYAGRGFATLPPDNLDTADGRTQTAEEARLRTSAPRVRMRRRL